MKPTDFDHERFMRLALQTAAEGPGADWYGVGCVIAGADGRLIAAACTNELTDEDGKGCHAEEGAIRRALSAGSDLKGAVLYSTLEPCSIRASGKTPCTVRIIEAGIAVVVYGAREPYEPSLGVVCEGHEKLEQAGLTVIEMKEIAEECLKSALSKRKPPRINCVRKS